MYRVLVPKQLFKRSVTKLLQFNTLKIYQKRFYQTELLQSNAHQHNNISFQHTVEQIKKDNNDANNNANNDFVTQIDLEAKDSKEIKDPVLIFESVMKRLEAERGLNNLVFPKEILFLAGAPGSGKGTVCPFIMKERGLTAPPIVMSNLLNTPELREMKNKGELVSDKIVIDLVLRELLDPKYSTGVIVDGFPRSKVQAECISLLYDRMLALRKKFLNTPDGFKFRRPQFQIIVLFCEEKVSVQRQLHRGHKAIEINNRHKNMGILELQGKNALVEERPTDLSEEKAQQRYQFFKESIFESLKLLKKKFHYHFIDANGTIEEVKAAIHKELKYQSSLELAHETFEKISSIPLAEELTRNARQQLVMRLDRYQTHQTELFDEVISIIKKEFEHILQRQGLCGVAIIRSENPVFQNPSAVDMILDIFTERGFQIALDIERKQVPDAIDPKTFKIINKTVNVYHFHLKFEPPVIRN